MKKFKIVLFVFLIATSLISNAQRTSERLIDGWEYVKGDLGGVYEAIRIGKTAILPVWSKVEMPHCFNEFDAVDPDCPYYQGPGWYRKYLAIDQFKANQRALLHFEGAGQKTQVYIGKQLVGSHVGGYDEFTIDISDAIASYKEFKNDAIQIPLIIRCDNSRDLEMIPSDLSDFNIYGGLYRYVNLITASEVSLEKIHITSKLDEKYKNAKVSIKSTLYNPLFKGDKGSIKYAVRNSKGELIHEATEEFSLTQAQLAYTFSIKKPQLWSVQNPVLYTLEATIETEAGIDQLTQQFGLRNFEFIPHGPFLLNGERLFLRGTHRHEDHAAYAQAMPEELIIQEMEMMKEMGVNFIRLAHYQQSRIVLDACDRLGILVWEEIPWCRGGLGGESYKNQARRMLTNLINQHYNHPSIIIWGLGNENDWPGDFAEFEEAKIRTFMSELNDLSHSLDSERKTAIRRCDFCSDIVDVYSPSIWAGWYRGKYTDYTKVSKEWNDKVDAFLHVEWGASNHACRHSENPDKGLESISGGNGADERDGDFLLTGGVARVSKDGDWSETYATNLIDWHLKEQEKMDWHIGTAYWPFKDFSTPLRPENPVPYVNQKGVVERDFTKKESFYVFQSYWTEKPMTHIYGHTFPVRWGEKDENKLVKVYSNCDKAELFLNGKSLGIKKRDSQNFPAAGLRWYVNFNEGENQLKVIATKGKETVTDEISQIYQTAKWDAPSILKLKELSREGNIVELEVTVFDRNNIFCPDAKNEIRFGVAGDGILLDNLGTSNGSRLIQLYNGRARIKVKLTGGKTIASAKSEGLLTCFVELKK